MPDQPDLHKPYVREATLEDVVYLSTRLRKADIDEIEASSGGSPAQALVEGFRYSSKCRVGVYNNNPFVIFGARPVVQGVGAIWALGSDDLLKARVEFLRQSKKWVDVIHQDFPLLFNYIDARNTVHIRWVRWLGFKFINIHPEHGVSKLPFYEFVRITDHV